MKLKNKTIILTGSEGLIGKAIAQDILKEGGQLVSIDIGLKHEPENGNFQYDLTKIDQLPNYVQEILEYYPTINGLVNNAYPRTKDWGNEFDAIDSKSWSNNVEWQMNSPILLTQSLLNQLENKIDLSIVNIGSIYGIVGPSFEVYQDLNMTMPAAYSAIKGGLLNFTRYLATLTGKHGVRANMVSPGGIFDHQHPEFVKRYESLTPLNRMGNPNDISPAVVFLLSEDSAYISGQNLVIDGGFTAR